MMDRRTNSGDAVMLPRVVQAVALVLLLCVGVRLAAWLIEPVLPALGVLCMVVVVASWLLVGPRVNR